MKESSSGIGISGIPLSDLLDMIYQTEKEIEQHQEEGD